MKDDDGRAWIERTAEDPVDAGRRIIDPHHHLHDAPERRYLLADFFADIGAGHNIVASVFVENGAGYRSAGPPELQPVGETEFVVDEIRAHGLALPRIGAIVGFADLGLGDRVDEVLEVHEQAGAGLFRGIRHQTAWDASPELQIGHAQRPGGLMGQSDFQRGAVRLGELGYSFDAWLYHPQIPELVELARRAEETQIVLDHLGAPLNLGPYGDRAAVRSAWRRSMQQLSTCPNVAVKLGGFGMDQLFFRTEWSLWSAPPTSDQVVQWWGDDVRWCIDTFGPGRCMFESNYPVDRQSIGYTVLWNACKKMASAYSADEQNELFLGTAAGVYRIDLDPASLPDVL